MVQIHGCYSSPAAAAAAAAAVSAAAYAFVYALPIFKHVCIVSRDCIARQPDEAAALLRASACIVAGCNICPPTAPLLRCHHIQSLRRLPPRARFIYVPMLFCAAFNSRRLRAALRGSACRDHSDAHQRLRAGVVFASDDGPSGGSHTVTTLPGFAAVNIPLTAMSTLIRTQGENMDDRKGKRERERRVGRRKR